ncbi:MAG: efflux RND transporter periplasmic adaptor subunit [Planctomycetales bacterium]|nr:efflux RND transporter periplasmic adaptor subunit [Planctomycetales bacterium]
MLPISAIPFPAARADRLARRSSAAAMVLLVVGLVLGLAGCTSRAEPPSPAADSLARDKVYAQGQILPAAGFIQLSAAPGDIVEQVHVMVGESVQQGQLLLSMRSGTLLAEQLAPLRMRREEAARQQDVTVNRARQQRDAAQLQLDQRQAQQAALARRERLLELAQQQVLATQRVLQQLEAISSNAATREFVGQLEIERQKIAVSEAELNYRQQAEAQQQAADELQWAQRAAESELAAAELLLASSQASQAVSVLDLEIQALEKQAAAASVVAPTAGVILALNVQAGEASGPRPLLEMADLQALVCEVEINEMDAALVQPGQPATLRSQAWGEQELSGRVEKKFKLVGRPQLRPLDPLARADYRTVTAVITLDASSVPAAQEWLQLQVQVEIDTDDAP